MASLALRAAGAEEAKSCPPEPNPPAWPPSVRVFAPEDPEPGARAELLAALGAELNDRARGHFSRERLALLFRPGVYRDFDVPIGYYTQILGLGKRAGDVVFTDGARGPYCAAADKRPGGAGSLDTFWRAAENFRTEAPAGMLWAVSQAAPLRRVHVRGDLILHDEGRYASGGFLANVRVDGALDFGSQQQWCARNARVGSGGARGGAWSLVFVDSDGALPAARASARAAPNAKFGGEGPLVTRVSGVGARRALAEKPFVVVDAPNAATFSLVVPKPYDTEERAARGDGDRLDDAPAADELVPFERVFGARSDADADGATIQAKLDAGLHVVLAPGVYELNHTLTLRFEGQVLLGLGLASLVAPRDGAPAVRVTGAALAAGGARVAGVMLQAAVLDDAAAYARSCLLEVGVASERNAGRADNPVVLSDVFCRVGGGAPAGDARAAHENGAAARALVVVRGAHVVGDNLWLWRADHTALAPGEAPREGEVYHLVAGVDAECRCEHGLVVDGRGVTMVGLAVEHTTRDNVVWRGDDGAVYFYQNELPYDATHAAFGAAGYVGYAVDGGVATHEARGVGVYSFFRDAQVLVPAAIRAPDAPGVVFENAFTRHLDGHSGILSVLNGRGGATGAAMGWLPPPAAPGAE